MLNWWKRRVASSASPDYRHVDSLQKAQRLYRRGELAKLLLLPAEFGGRDVASNVVYVPSSVVESKVRIDLNTIAPMVEKGQARSYTAAPEYEGKSVIPSCIRIAATDPGCFEFVIAIWGKVLESQPPLSRAQIADYASFTLSSATLENLTPEEFVRAYIADYERWNTFAHSMWACDPGVGMDIAEAAYSSFVRKFCPADRVHQPIAFGSDSAHDANEVIVSVESSGDACVIKTRRTVVIDDITMSDDYEYHLQKSGARWFLLNVYYVDQDGRYEGL